MIVIRILILTVFFYFIVNFLLNWHILDGRGIVISCLYVLILKKSIPGGPLRDALCRFFYLTLGVLPMYSTMRLARTSMASM